MAESTPDEDGTATPDGRYTPTPDPAGSGDATEPVTEESRKKKDEGILKPDGRYTP